MEAILAAKNAVLFGRERCCFRYDKYNGAFYLHTSILGGRNRFFKVVWRPAGCQWAP